MKGTITAAIVLGTALLAGVASASPKPGQDIQAPRGIEVEAPRGGNQDIQSPRGGNQDIQSPRGGNQDIQSPRG